MQKAGLIPFMFVVVQSMAVLHSYNTCNSFSTYTTSKPDDIITGKVELGPKKAYLRWAGSGFKSSCGGSSIDGFAGGVALSSKRRGSN